MARIMIDGFEGGDLSLWDTAYNVTTATALSGMHGNYCLNVTSLSSYLEVGLGSSLTEVYFSMKFRPHTSLSQYHGILTLYDDTYVMTRITMKRDISVPYTDTPVEVRVGSSAVAESTQTMNLDTTYRIQGYVKIAESGRIVVKVNGVTWIDYSGDTTIYSHVSVDTARLGASGTTYSGGYARFDDVVFDTTNYPGDTAIEGLMPSAAGSSTQWDASETPNYDCVDEYPPDDDDYVFTNVIDEVDLYGLGNLVGDIESIICVQVSARSKYSGTPTPTNLKLAVRPTSTTYVSSNKVVPADWNALYAIWQTNPQTSNPWSESEINAMEAGIKSAT